MYLFKSFNTLLDSPHKDTSRNSALHTVQSYISLASVSHHCSWWWEWEPPGDGDYCHMMTMVWCSDDDDDKNHKARNRGGPRILVHIYSYPPPWSTRNSLGSCSFIGRQSVFLLLLEFVCFFKCEMWKFISFNKNLIQVLQIINHTKHAEIGQSLLYTRHSWLRKTVDLFRMIIRQRYNNLKKPKEIWISAKKKAKQPIRNTHRSREKPISRACTSQVVVSS